LRTAPGSLVRPFFPAVPASRGGVLSIVLLAILAVMWAAFLLPLIAPGQRRSRKRAAAGDGWRPASGSGPGGRRDTPRRLARRRAVLRRRRVLLALSIAVAVAVRARYLLGGRWWIAEVVTGALLLAYVCALVVQGRRRRRRLASRERPDRQAAPRERWPFHWRRRRRAELPLWSAPLLEGQGLFAFGGEPETGRSTGAPPWGSPDPSGPRTPPSGTSPGSQITGERRHRPGSPYTVSIANRPQAPTRPE
jgi:hypothetical protein